MTAKDAIKIGIIAGATIHVISVGIRATITLIEGYRFNNNDEYRENLRQRDYGRYWCYKRKYSK